MRPLGLATLLGLATQAQAVGGLWPPQALPSIEESLHAAGLAVDPRDLSDPQKYPLNAVVELGDHCTAILVSPFGLLLGNRRCVLDALRLPSADSHDTARVGLLARTLGEELPGAPGVRLTVSVQDVSAQLRAGLSAPEGDAGAAAIERRKDRLLAACASSPGHRCRIHASSGDSEFWLVKQRLIPDVRLVYVPAAVDSQTGAEDGSVGPLRFGADFVLLRAYVGPDGRPAEASELNVPLRPPSHLKLQPAGLAPGDFAMAVAYTVPTAGSHAELKFGFGKVHGLSDAVSGGVPPFTLLADFDFPASAGSPLLNARAELVGMAFAAEQGTSPAHGPRDTTPLRSIAVDVRQVLSRLAAVDAADRLLQELGAVPVVVDAG